ETMAADPEEGARIAAALGFEAVAPAGAPPAEEGLRLYDLSGRVVAAMLRADLPGLRGLSFDGMRVVSVWLDAEGGPLRLDFPRRRVSASNPHQLLVLMVVFGA